MNEIDKSINLENQDDENHELDMMNITPEQYAAYKKYHSRKRRTWSDDELKERFPNHQRSGNVFITEKGDKQRVFRFFNKYNNEGGIETTYAHEVSRATLDVTKPKNHPFSTLVKDHSVYDGDGYLIYFAVVISNTLRDPEYPLKNRESYQQTFEYTDGPNGKELARVTQQQITKTIDLMPGVPIGKPNTIDFTNVPLE